MSLPDPLTAPEIDLRNFPYMPLEVVRLRDSDLAGVASAEGFRAAVILWCVAWHQFPAASLPDDDRMLARHAGFGRDVDGWLAVKDEALHRFVKCSDGRLYHPTIAEKATEAWEAKKKQRARTEAARKARMQQSAVSDTTESETFSVTETVTESKGREGKGIEIAATASLRSAAAAAPPPLDKDEFKLRCERAAGRSYEQGWGKILELRGTHSDERIVTIIESQSDAAVTRAVRSWAWFAAAIDDEHRETPGPPKPPPEPVEWVPVGERFTKANAALLARGLRPKSPNTAASQDGLGWYFPKWAADAATEDAA